MFTLFGSLILAGICPSRSVPISVVVVAVVAMVTAVVGVSTTGSSWITAVLGSFVDHSPASACAFHRLRESQTCVDRRVGLAELPEDFLLCALHACHQHIDEDFIEHVPVTINRQFSALSDIVIHRLMLFEFDVGEGRARSFSPVGACESLQELSLPIHPGDEIRVSNSLGVEPCQGDAV